MARRSLFPAAIAALLLSQGGCGDCDCPSGRVVVAVALEAGGSTLAAVETREPWGVEPSGIALDGEVSLRVLEGRVVAVGRGSGVVTVVDPDRWTVEAAHPIGGALQLEDVALVAPGIACVSARDSASLFRLDLATGAVEAAVDLSVFADADGLPEPGTMLVDGSRLFIQIRRWNDDAVAFVPPALLAVVDLETWELVDTDPAAPGVQAIELEGTAPRGKMQVLPGSRLLHLSATGGFFDAGGIEAVDLDALRSDGLVIREADGLTGADLGAFLLVEPDRGFLVFSTDLALSSHLHAFRIPGGVEEGELYVSVGTFVPELVLDPGTGSFFLPDGGGPPAGIHAFDARTGARRTGAIVDVGGRPGDLVLLP